MGLDRVLRAFGLQHAVAIAQITQPRPVATFRAHGARALLCRRHTHRRRVPVDIDSLALRAFHHNIFGRSGHLKGRLLKVIYWERSLKSLLTTEPLTCLTIARQAQRALTKLGPRL